MKAFALVGIDGEVHAVATDREDIEKLLENNPFSSLENIKEFEYNDEPMTERGVELTKKIQEHMKDVKHIHLNKQLGFYEMHVDDRLQMMYDLFEDLKTAKPFEVNDSPLEVERYAETLEEQLKAEGIQLPQGEQ